MCTGTADDTVDSSGGTGTANCGEYIVVGYDGCAEYTLTAGGVVYESYVTVSS